MAWLDRSCHKLESATEESGESVAVEFLMVLEAARKHFRGFPDLQTRIDNIISNSRPLLIRHKVDPWLSEFSLPFSEWDQHSVEKASGLMQRIGLDLHFSGVPLVHTQVEPVASPQNQQQNRVERWIAYLRSFIHSLRPQASGPSVVTAGQISYNTLDGVEPDANTPRIPQ